MAAVLQCGVISLSRAPPGALHPVLEVLGITGPIYVAILLGYLATRFGVFSKSDMRVLGRFVLNFALPALLFHAMATRPIGALANGPYLLAYAAGSFLLIGASLLWGRATAKPPIARVFHAMGMTCSNSGFVGYPILLLTLPQVAGIALALNMIVENLFEIPFLLALAERQRVGAGSWWQTARRSLARLGSTPMIVGLAAGVVVSALAWTPPAAVVRAIDLFSATSAALSLFVIGGTLVGLPLGGMARRVAPVAFGKLVLHPLAVWGAMMALPYAGLALAPELRTAAVLLAAMPMLSIFTIFAQPHGQEDFAAPALLVATIASFFSISALLWLLGPFPGLPSP